MQALTEVPKNQIYQIQAVDASPESKKHLHDLGILTGNRIALLSLDDKNGIVMLQHSRIALERAMVAQIKVVEITTHGEWLSLDQLKAGESGQVVSIYGKGAIRRRLMDMGVTKNVSVKVKKVAPLGDPIEITIRGYELTLRKDEAAFILIEKETY